MSIGSTISQWWEDRTPGQKVGLVAVGGYVTYRIGESIFSNDNSGGTSGSLSCGSSNLTYTTNEYIVLADAMEEAIWGSDAIADWTEDDEVMGDILFQMKTTDDMCRLNNEYGERYVGVFIESGGNLTQMMTEYLDNDIKAAVNEYFQAMNIDWFFP